MNIKLNEPIVLLPLRLEIRRFKSSGAKQTPLAKYKLKEPEQKISLSRKYIEFENQANIEQRIFQNTEYWIRWYPDEIHFLAPVGKITQEEKDAWEEFYKTFERHKEAGSVHELRNPQDPEYVPISTEKLKVFYGLSPGSLSDDELIKANDYDEKARRRINQEKLGVREALGWQDLENPEMKQAWLEFSEKVGGPVRARQIAKNEESGGKWDFDTEIEETDPTTILMDQGIPILTLPESINLYTIKYNNRTQKNEIKPLVLNIAIKKHELLVSPVDLEGTHWRTDFEIAVEKGMGIKITGTTEARQIDQADWLIAVGVNESDESRKVLEEILRRNDARGELAIVAQDSPTNNTETAKSPHTELEMDAEHYLEKTKMNIPDNAPPESSIERLRGGTPDAHLLSDVFGLDSPTLSEMPGAELQEQNEASAMAMILWNACTVSSFLLWRGLLPDVNNSNWSVWGEFFIDNVRARGPLAVLKVGENPYGVLPVVSLRDFPTGSEKKTDQEDWLKSLEKFCSFMKEEFLLISRSLALPKLDEVKDDKKFETLQEILRLHSVSNRDRVDLRIVEKNPLMEQHSST